jgi:hypothetical protein
MLRHLSGVSGNLDCDLSHVQKLFLGHQDASCQISEIMDIHPTIQFFLSVKLTEFNRFSEIEEYFSLIRSEQNVNPQRA